MTKGVEMTGVDTKSAIAWRQFEQALGEALELLDDDFFVVGVMTGEDPADGSAPYLQFGMTEDDELHAEVSSNSYLAPAYALDDAATGLLLELGWEATEQNFTVVATRDEARPVAGLATRVLREVFDVVHPAFLRVEDLVVAASLGLVAPVDRAPAPPEAHRPQSLAHLRRLVEQALAPLVGADSGAGSGAGLEVDDDGDYALELDRVRVWVCVESPFVVRVMGYAVRGMTDRDAAVVEARILNRDARFVVFTPREDAMEARIVLPCLVLVPETLRSMVVHLTQVMGQVGEDLALRTGGD